MISSAADRPLPRLLSAGALTAAAAAVIAIFAPGKMSQDSVSQLEQGRAGVYTDWHPPVMSALWGLLDRIVAGPLPMLILQVSAFALGGYLLFRAMKLSRWPAVALAIALLFYPPHLANVVIIWKDIQLGTALLLGFAVMLWAFEKQSRALGAVAFVVISYGLAVRHNALPAVVPFALLAGFELRTKLRPNLTRSRAVAVASGVGVALLVVSYVLGSAVNRGLSSGPPTALVQAILLHDVVAVTRDTGVSFVPDYLKNEQQTPENLARMYSVNEVVPLFCCDNAPFRFKLTNEPAHIRETWHSWFAAVKSAPAVYLRHRVAVLASLEGVGRKDVCLPYIDGIVPNSLGLSYPQREPQLSLMRFFDRVDGWLPFRGWFISAMLLVLLALSWWRLGALHPSAVLAASGLLYELPYLFVATTCDFRMHWWSSVAMVSAGVLLIAHWRRPPLAPRATPDM